MINNSGRSSSPFPPSPFYGQSASAPRRRSDASSLSPPLSPTFKDRCVTWGDWRIAARWEVRGDEMLFSLYVCSLLEVISSVSQTGTHKTRSLCFSSPSAAMRGTERKVVAFPGPHFPPPAFARLLALAWLASFHLRLSLLRYGPTQCSKIHLAE